jgi:hypothetical protein
MATIEHVPLGDVYGLLNRAIREAGSQAKFASDHGITATHVNDVLHARRPPSPQILAALKAAKAAESKIKTATTDGEFR